MGLIESLEARQRDLESRLARLEARVSKAEDTSGMTREEAARLLRISVSALEVRLNTKSKYYDAALERCSYKEGRLRRFVPQLVEAYRAGKVGNTEKSAEARAEKLHGREQAIPPRRGQDSLREDPEPPPRDCSA